MIPLLLGGLTVFITHALEAVTGFGCTVLALPFITALLGVKEAVMVLTFLAWILALYIAFSKWKQIDFRQYAIIAALMLCGLPAGIFLFRTADLFSLKMILAVFIILSAALQLLKLSGVIHIDKPLPKPLAVLLLVAALMGFGDALFPALQSPFGLGASLAGHEGEGRLPDHLLRRVAQHLRHPPVDEVFLI